MLKRLYFIPLLFLFAVPLQAEVPDSIIDQIDRNFDFNQFINDITDIPMFWDALNARRSISANTSLTKTFFDDFFGKSGGIAVGLVHNVKSSNQFGHWFDTEKYRGTYKANEGQRALLFHVDFIQDETRERFYKINFKIKKETAGIEGADAIERDTSIIKKEYWRNFDTYIEEINKSQQTYTRGEFKTELNKLITKGLFILLDMNDFPLEVLFQPAFARAIDSIAERSQREVSSYEWIPVGRDKRAVRNVALKVGDVMPLQISVKRMEIDSVEKTITLSNGTQFSSLDDVIEFEYTASAKGDDAITATYETEEGRQIAGKLNISVYEEKPPFSVVLVPVQGSESANKRVGNINQGEIETFLNAVYDQAVVEWGVAVESPLQVRNFNGNLKTDAGSTDMTNIIDAYTGNVNVEKETYYIFIVPELTDAKPGSYSYMPLNGKYGFVAYNTSSEQLGRRIAHELGHGAFGLKHIFEEYASIREGSTNNLMDHVNSMPQGCTELCISKLYRYQWDLIQGSLGGQKEEEEKPISLIDTGFLFVSIEGKKDTLFNGHTLILPKQNTPIKLKIGYNAKDLYSRAYNADLMRRNNLIVEPSDWKDLIKLERTEWSRGSINKQGEIYEISEPGTYDLFVNAVDAIVVRLKETETAGGRYIQVLGDDDAFINRSDSRNHDTLTKIRFRIKIIDGGIITFKPKNEDYYLNYGFDDAMFFALQQANNHTKDYNKLPIPNIDYYVPWLHLTLGTDNAAEIKIEYIGDLTSDPDAKLKLVADKNILFFPDSEESDNKTIALDVRYSQNIQIEGLNEGICTIYAYVVKGEQEILAGRLDVEVRDVSNPKKVRIIRVKRDDETEYIQFSNQDKEALIDKINSLYKQSFILFEHDAGYHDIMRVDETTEQLIDLATLRTQMGRQIPGGETLGIHYIYLCTQGVNRGRGIGAVGGKTSVIFINDDDRDNISISNKYRTFAHELGHNFGLRHTFAPQVNGRELRMGSTKNIMDYFIGTDLRKYFLRYQIIEILKNR